MTPTFLRRRALRAESISEVPPARVAMRLEHGMLQQVRIR